ncbi:MAG: DNA-binding protein WhiA [Mycoplasmatales bacterium]|nr:DNA-binding protein WhiA [Mycoplasmatales bacterium]
MSFAQRIKKELLNQEFASELALSFISGLISSSSVRSRSKIIVKLNNNEISNIIKDMFDQLIINYESSKENRNWIVLKNYHPTIDIKHPSYYFAGAFVGGGSISDSASLFYHLEIQLYSHFEAEKMKNFLNKYSFKFSLIQRRKMFVLYIKKAEQISDFLRAIQAFNSLMEFENERIQRDFSNQLNRYSNLDSYNQQKLAIASSKFLDRYAYILENNLTGRFRIIELEFFKIKFENQFSSLEELTNLFYEKTKIKKTRAGLNHWLIKLRKVSEE